MWPDGPATNTPFLPLQSCSDLHSPGSSGTAVLLLCSFGAESLLCISTHVLCSWLWDLILTELLIPLMLFFVCPLLSSDALCFPHLLFIYRHLSTSPFCCQDSMRSEPSSLLGFCIKCAQQFGLWRLCTGCCSEMNIVYLCNEHNTSIISVHWAEFLTSCNILSLLQQFHKVNPYLLAHWKSSREIYMWYGIIYFEKVF